MIFSAGLLCIKVDSLMTIALGRNSAKTILKVFDVSLSSLLMKTIASFQ